MAHDSMAASHSHPDDSPKPVGRTCNAEGPPSVDEDIPTIFTRESESLQPPVFLSDGDQLVSPSDVVQDREPNDLPVLLLLVTHLPKDSRSIINEWEPHAIPDSNAPVDIHAVSAIVNQAHFAGPSSLGTAPNAATAKRPPNLFRASFSLSRNIVPF